MALRHDGIWVDVERRVFTVTVTALRGNACARRVVAQDRPRRVDFLGRPFLLPTTLLARRTALLVCSRTAPRFVAATVAERADTRLR